MTPGNDINYWCQGYVHFKVSYHIDQNVTILVNKVNLLIGE